MQTVKHATSVAILLSSVICGSAYATQSQYSFSATVTANDGVLGGVDVGTTFSGKFSYEPTPVTTSPNFSAYIDPANTFEATIGTHEIVTDHSLFSVYINSTPNVYSIGFLAGSPVHLDGELLAYGSVGWGLTNPQGIANFPYSLELPTTYDLSTFNYKGGWFRTDQSGKLLTFTINSITAVPEPGTFVLMLPGIAAVACAVRRRRSVN